MLCDAHSVLTDIKSNAFHFELWIYECMRKQNELRARPDTYIFSFMHSIICWFSFRCFFFLFLFWKTFATEKNPGMQQPKRRSTSYNMASWGSWWQRVYLISIQHSTFLNAKHCHCYCIQCITYEGLAFVSFTKCGMQKKRKKKNGTYGRCYCYCNQQQCIPKKKISLTFAIRDNTSRCLSLAESRELLKNWYEMAQQINGIDYYFQKPCTFVGTIDKTKMTHLCADDVCDFRAAKAISQRQIMRRTIQLNNEKWFVISNQCVPSYNIIKSVVFHFSCLLYSLFQSAFQCQII